MYNVTVPTTTAKMQVSVDKAVAIFFTLLNGSMLLVGYIGSIMVLTAIYYFRRLHTTSNAFIANLSVADFGALTVGMVTITLGLFFADIVSKEERVCKMLIHVTFLFLFTSMATLQCIAVDRYMIITKPRYIYNKYFSRIGAGVLLAGTWGISLILTVGSLSFCGEVSYVTEINGCYIDNKDIKSWWCLTAVFLLACLPCMITIPLFFVLTFCKIRKTRRKVEASAANMNSKNQVLSKEEVAVTRMMLIVYITFLVCWLPLLLVHATHYDRYPSYTLHYGTCIMALFNSALNPIVYAGMNRLLRRSFVKILRCRLRSNQTDTSFSLDHTAN